MPYACPKICKADLLTQCRELGVQSGDLLMVHASMKAVGEILGGPDVLIEAILESVGESGTLMAYLGCELPFDDVGRGLFSESEEQFIRNNIPAFDPRKARANREHGIFAEFFRTYDGVVCSRNPGSRMAALGAKASWLMADHPYDYGLGLNSPLDKFCGKDGKVLLIGSDLDNVTLLHFAEAVAVIPEKRLVKISLPLLLKGQKEWLEVVEFDSSTGVKVWADNFFSQIMLAFIETGAVNSGRLGNADCCLFNGRKLVEFAVPLMEQTAEKLSESSPAAGCL